MLKRFLPKALVCLALALLLGALCAVAASADQDGDWYYSVADGKATVTGYSGSATSITIPSKLGGYTVTAIGAYAFDYCTGLTSVTIPNSVTDIGDYVFYNCYGLTTLTLGSGVKTIGDYVFYGCSSLTRVDVASLADWCKIDFADDYANPLDSGATLYVNGSAVSLSGVLTIPSGVTSIGSRAFIGCALTRVNIPDSVAGIGDGAFEYCGDLTRITLGSGLKTIGYCAFGDCGSLSRVDVTDLKAWCEIDFGDNPLYYGASLYLNGAKLSGAVTIPSSVTSIGNGAFYNCGLTSVTIPKSVTSIGASAFSGCSSLTTLKLSSGLKTIGNGAFYCCTGLKTVTVPKSVTSIGDSAFANCSGLTSITLGSGLKTIGDYAFQNCGRLTDVTIPAGVTSIGDWAFSSCSSLTSVTIPYTVTDIGEGAFCSCCALESAVLPEGLTRVNGDTFSGCSAMTTVTLPASLESVGVGAFNSCSSLATVRFSGTAAQWAELDIARDNAPLENAAVEFFAPQKPVITTQPKNLTVAEGSEATFTVAATGADSYQWYVSKDGGSTWSAVASGGTSATYSFTTAARHNGYKYKCAAKNDVGATESDAATLTVLPSAARPVIAAQTISVTAGAGSRAYFNVVATGADSYQWYVSKDGGSTWTAVSSGGKSDTYSLTTAARHDGYKYKCAVTNLAGTTESDAITLTVISAGAKPVITTQPTSVTVAAGSKATFKVVATGATGYQWYVSKDGGGTWSAVSSGGTSATYSFTTAARHNGYKYKCVVKNAAGTAESNVVTLTVTAASAKPVITTQPTDKTVTAGSKATFKVVATGATGYQWYVSKDGGSSWTAVASGGTSATYSFTTAARHNGYKYKCAVKNAARTTYSNVVTLTVN